MTKIPRGQTPEMREYQKNYRATHPRDRSAYKKAYDAPRTKKSKKDTEKLTRKS